MKRLNFTLDQDTVKLLERLSARYYDGNKSQTVRAALESLAAHAGKEGWIIKGYSAMKTDQSVTCHECGTEKDEGALFYKPVFEKGNSASAVQVLPDDEWLECPDCVQMK